jgi:hypothetical protein
MRRAIALVFVAVIGTAACKADVKVGTGAGAKPKIDKVELARDFKDGKAVGVGTVLSPDTNPIHAVVTFSGASEDTKIKATAIAVNAGGQQDRELYGVEEEAGKESGVLDVTFSLPRPWPTGDYKVDVSIDGKLAKSVAYSIQ